MKQIRNIIFGIGLTCTLSGCLEGPLGYECDWSPTSDDSQWFEVERAYADSGCRASSARRWASSYQQAESCATGDRYIPAGSGYQEPASCNGGTTQEQDSSADQGRTCSGGNANSESKWYDVVIISKANGCVANQTRRFYANSQGEANGCAETNSTLGGNPDDLCYYYFTHCSNGSTGGGDLIGIDAAQAEACYESIYGSARNVTSQMGGCRSPNDPNVPSISQFPNDPSC